MHWRVWSGNSFCNLKTTFLRGIDSLYIFPKRNIIWKIPESFSYGNVYVSFTKDTLGTIKEAKIAKGIWTPLDKETLKVILIMPKWKPVFEINGNIKWPIHVIRNLPIDFHK